MAYKTLIAVTLSSFILYFGHLTKKTSADMAGNFKSGISNEPSSGARYQASLKAKPVEVRAQLSETASLAVPGLSMPLVLSGSPLGEFLNNWIPTANDFDSDTILPFFSKRQSGGADSLKENDKQTGWAETAEANSPGKARQDTLRKNDELFHLNQLVTGFADHTASAKVFFISESGEIFILNDRSLFDSGRYDFDPSCNLKSQDPSGISGEGMTLAYPYLVGMGKVCFIDETKKRVAVVADFKKQLPRNAFTISYVAGDDQSVYFVVNGKADGESGYINVVAINKKTHATALKPLIIDVLGFSAAMVVDSQQLWVTTWMDNNQLYRLELTKLLELIKSGKSYSFGDVALQTYDPFAGLSAFVLRNDTELLYLNKSNDSYRINSDSGRVTSKPFPHDCEPVSGYKKNWLLLCSGNSIVLE